MRYLLALWLAWPAHAQTRLSAPVEPTLPLSAAAESPELAPSLASQQPSADRGLDASVPLSASVSASPLASHAQAQARDSQSESRACPTQSGNSSESVSANDRLFDGLSLKGDRLMGPEGKAPFLGQGEFGIVSVHPLAPNKIVKVVSHSFEVAVFAGVHPRDTAKEEEQTSRRLAAAGVGPAYYAQGTIPIQPGSFGAWIRRKLGLAPARTYRAHASVRERVQGETVASLIYDRKFGPEEYRLVLEMLDRMADHRLRTDDMRPPNIMIGTTETDPVRKAYLVDGGKILDVDPRISRDDLRHTLQYQNTLIMARMDPNVGWIETVRPFDQILQEGLARGRQSTAWQKIKAFFKQAYASPIFPAK